jgi:hypothetical protein
VRQNLAMASSDPTSGGDGDRDVFGSLPNTRPQRRSAKRDRGGAKAKSAAAAQAQTAAAKPKAKAGAAKAKPAAATARARPKASASAKSTPAADAGPAPAATKIPPAGYATPRGDDGVPRGADLVITAVQAAGELAHIGLAAGGRALKSALERLPRP